ncbi:MAG: DUF4384 domain-containing protein [Deltaproteobacteria bacterium]|nr:DUF4384 domain-containing protein [Deltaproteobacteria bacterium]MBN2674008.1 DUF4384 domain-containing protein [Deltaproteobacteria bacterium]
MAEAVFTVSQIEMLLAMRRSDKAADDDVPLEAVAAALENSMQGIAAREELHGLAEVKITDEEMGLFLSIRDEEIFDARTEADVQRPKWRTAIWIAAAAVVVIAVAAAMVGWRSEIFKTSPTTLTPKGMTHDFQIAVSRNGQQFPLTVGKNVETGDHLGFFYTTPEDGYLAVFFVDAAKTVQPLFPTAGDTSYPITRGTSVPVPDGAVVTPAIDCEWIVAVFSSTEMSLREIEHEIKRTMQVDSDCHLRVTPGGTSRVRIKQIRGRVTK